MSDAPFSSQCQPLDGGRVRLSLQGELDYSTAPFARRDVLAAQDGAREVLIDLSGIEKADVFGLAVLLKAWHAGPRNGCRIRLVSASQSVQRAWRATNMLGPPARVPTRSPAAAA